MRKKLTLLFMTIIFSLISISFTKTATAATLSSDDQAAIDSAPTGLNMSDYFTIMNPTNNLSSDHFRFRSNSAFFSDNNKVIVLANGTATNSNDNSSNGFLGVNGVKNATGSYGAAWSNIDSAYFEAGKMQTLSAWLYFGPGGGNGSEITNGQGMALVLQNNTDGSTQMGAGQQGLGVYGFDDSTSKAITYSLLSNADVAKSAVQNSIALEFDTQTQENTRTSSSPYAPIKYYQDSVYYYSSLNSFDTKDATVTRPDGFPDDTSLGSGGAFGHIAVTYPADPLTYHTVRTPYYNQTGSYYNLFNPFKEAYSMFHIDRQQNAQLVNSNDGEVWHHVTVHWTPAADLKTATLTYSFNDKKTDGTINNASDRIDQSVTVNMSELGNITSDSKIYWGFTGANGNLKKSDDEYYDVASKLVSVESIPDLVNSQVKTTVTDKTQNKTMFDDPDTGDKGDDTDRQVANGDKLAINYNLKYIDGRKDWKDIAANIILPKNVTYDTSSSNIGVITYDNGDTENIPSSTLKTNDEGEQYFDYTLLQNLGNNDAKSAVANITINGTAVNETTKDITVAAQPANFRGSNNIVSSSTPEFTIRYKKTWTLNLQNDSENPLTLLYKQDNATLNLDNTLTYSDKDSPSFAKGDTIHYKIDFNGQSYTYDQVVDSDSDKLTTSIPMRELIEKAGSDFWELFPLNSEQKITISASDTDNVISNSITYNVQVKVNHLLELSADPSLIFQSVNYFSNQKYLSRKNDYDVNVTSYRNPWTLQVEASPLTNDDDSFNGILVNKTDESAIPLTNNLITIATDSQSYDKNTSISIADLNNWTKDSGILLKQTGLSEAKSYQGTITWTVSDYTDSL